MSLPLSVCIPLSASLHTLLIDNSRSGTQHDANGDPTIDQSRFADLEGLVQSGHSKGLQVGWYLNGCKCAEKVDNPFNYAGANSS